MAAAIRILICLLLILHVSTAQKPAEDSVHKALIMFLNPQSFISLLLLGLSVVLSASIYLWVLRYVCIGCCQPIAVSAESEALVGEDGNSVWKVTKPIKALAVSHPSGEEPEHLQREHHHKI